MNINHGVLLTSLTLALAACGSGGSSSGGDSVNGIDTSLVNEAPLQITNENSRDIASRGVNQSQSLDKDADPSDFLTTDSRTRLVAKAVTSAYVKTDGFSARKTESQSADCDISGSVKVSVSDRNDDGVMDNGDSMTLDYNKCITGYDDETSTTDGKVVITINSLSEESNEVDIKLDFDALTMSDDDGKNVLDGDIGFSSSANDTVVSFSIDGNKLAFSADGEIGIMQDFNFTLTMNGDTSAWTQSQNVIYAGTDVDGKIVVETLITMQGVGGSHPSVGQVKISGANGSYMLIDADSGDANTVILTTFDGSSATTEELNWNELDD